MSIIDRFSEASARSILRAGYILAIVLVWQLNQSPLMGQFGSNVQHFPQVVFNSGSTTSFTIHNPSGGDSISVEVQILGSAGNSLDSRQVDLGPGATETVSFGNPQAALMRGWAELKSDDEFIATEFFQLFLGGLKPRVGVLPSPPSEEIRAVGFVAAQFKSGLAVHNPSPTQSVEITVRLKDSEGQQPLGEKTIELLPRQSVAGFLDDGLFFGSALASFEGVVEISAPSPVAALSLIQETSGDVTTVAVEVSTHIITGETNTAIGRSAFAANEEGDFNTASGAFALFSNTEGDANTANGAGALFSNTTGESNTASGFDALGANTGGDGNTATGASALGRNTTGFDNTASGVGALGSNTTGERNTAGGVDALVSNTRGNFNTASGYTALRDNTSGFFNTASGYSALISNTEGSQNTANGFRALLFNTTGNNNTASGEGALRTNETGSANTAIGTGADVTGGAFTNATAIGANAKVDASNKIRLGDDNVSVIEAPVGLTVVSDKTKKENFQPVDGEGVLRKLRSLEIPSWNFIGQDPENFRHYGPMAQDFFAAFGHDGVGMIATPTTINTNDLSGILMIAIQALERRTSQNAELKARIERLERAIGNMPTQTVPTGKVQ
ncbi:MAG: tail fiber domain-containing protein [Acidobacteriota bacterium]